MAFRGICGHRYGMKPNFEQLFGPAAGLVGAAILLFFLVLSVTWLLLPFILVGKLNKILSCLQAIETSAEATTRNTKSGGDETPPASPVRYIPGINS